LKPSSELQIPLAAGAAPGSHQALSALVYPADGTASAALILAHGAGAGQRSAFIVECARGIAAFGVDVITFDFPYISAGRKIPDRGPTLEAAYRAAIQAVHRTIDSGRRSLFVGGKSMGGRIATQVAAADRDLPAAGVVLLGYPLHPPGRPDTLRAAHLAAVGRPMLFVQGSRDAFGRPEELQPFLAPLSPVPTLYVVDGGDHSLKVPRRGPHTQAAVYGDVYRTIVTWMQSIADR
jgi:predicted alpha/beta-hydrolase family hydrolase